MKLTPKITLGLLTLIAIATLTLVVISSKEQSHLLLTSQTNRFKLEPFIQKNDEDSFTFLLSRLDIPENFRQGIQFELDSTSSAKLEFVTPAKISLNLTKNSINFSGETTIPLLSNQTEIKQIKFPASTNLAVFSPVSP